LPPPDGTDGTLRFIRRQMGVTVAEHPVLETRGLTIRFGGKSDAGEPGGSPAPLPQHRH